MSRILTYRDAINEALVQEMERDPRVVVFGIDVADHKRIYGTTKGLVEKFGGERCFSTPLSEDAMTGFALGAAINGLRPVHVHIRVDFMLLAVNQIFNMLSANNYTTGGRTSTPIVIRAVVGRGWGQSYQHSKSLHGTFAHIPGLKVVIPSRPADAKGLLISAIRDDNPVIFIEHRLLYDVTGEVPEELTAIPLGQPHLLRAGKDITLVATSWMTVEALKAADILARHGIELEVIDPRTIAPFDDSIILESVRKTGRLIVADNDWSFCGFSAEVSARAAESCLRDLKHPVCRLGFAHAPCPSARPLEDAFYPNAADIIRTAERILSRKTPIDLAGEEFYTYENKFKGPF